MKRIMTPRAKFLWAKARKWAKSPEGQRSIVRAIEAANKTAERMEAAQEPGFRPF